MEVREKIIIEMHKLQDRYIKFQKELDELGLQGKCTVKRRIGTNCV